MWLCVCKNGRFLFKSGSCQHWCVFNQADKWAPSLKKKKNPTKTATSVCGFPVIWARSGCVIKHRAKSVGSGVASSGMTNSREEGLCLAGAHYLKMQRSRAPQTPQPSAAPPFLHFCWITFISLYCCNWSSPFFLPKPLHSSCAFKTF